MRDSQTKKLFGQTNIISRTINHVRFLFLTKQFCLFGVQYFLFRLRWPPTDYHHHPFTL
jgi:hypothetical protein